eukprot:scaffold28448_cov30-Tisochrysis_lutea.AAC.2
MHRPLPDDRRALDAISPTSLPIRPRRRTLQLNGATAWQAPQEVMQSTCNTSTYAGATICWPHQRKPMHYGDDTVESAGHAPPEPLSFPGARAHAPYHLQVFPRPYGSS